MASAISEPAAATEDNDDNMSLFNLVSLCAAEPTSVTVPAPAGGTDGKEDAAVVSAVAVAGKQR